jgi:hypothetical protein
MLMSSRWNPGQNRDVNIANKVFENVTHSKYMGTTVNKS